MGWSFKWVSSLGSDFNFDYHVSFARGQVAHGTAIYNYAKAEASRASGRASACSTRTRAARVFHTYSCYARGIDMLNAAYHYLDLVPKGRDEAGLPYTMAWVRHRDEYGR